MGRVIFALAVLASIGVHTVIAGMWSDDEMVVAGGDVAGEVALGTSFADLVAGTLESATPDGEISPIATTAQPVQPQPREIVRPHVTATIKPISAANAETIENTQQIRSPKVANTVALQTISPRASTDTNRPTEARDALAVATSQRPTARPLPAENAERATEEAQVRRGNAEASAASGQQSGNQTRSTAQSSATRQTTSRVVGQGAINDYKSRVAARVIRVAERMRSRGSVGNVVVNMQISANGGLAAATIAQSSGNATADAIALDAIRRAAPFDPTPTGQGLSVAFAVQLVSR
ncbi:energy transducer TonB family protein [Yoonia sp. 2307UL14-13]|uniref:energy transducer TonB family protein n=1 Tax=Yoonia sp. 2307UL14-13 TaxID=3126506 RepID=UPI00309FE5EA